MLQNKIGLFLIGLLCLSSCIGADTGLESQEWLAYKAKFAKSYESRVEESMRHSIFLKNKQKVESHNAMASETVGFKMGLNKFSDRTDQELKGLLGFRLPDRHVQMKNNPEGEQFLAKILANNSAPLPKAVDWRKVPGVVSRVKDQGDCGSCWAFSTTGLLEGQQLNVTKANKLITLSEQNLLDCSKPNGCKGSWPSEALNFIFEQGGIDSENSYPYKGKENKCSYNQTFSVMQTRGPVILPQDEKILKAVVARYGPVSVGIDASVDFMFYENGILNDKTCENKLEYLNHAVLVVGYDRDPKHGNYWIIKNSWAEDWGEKGYIRMVRNRNNKCGIATMAVIAAFNKYTI